MTTVAVTLELHSVVQVNTLRENQLVEFFCLIRERGGLVIGSVRPSARLQSLFCCKKEGNFKTTVVEIIT